MSKINLCINLTPSYTTIYREDKGIVLEEPNKVLCQGEYEGVKILGYGSDAIKMQTDQFLIYPISTDGIDLSELYYARQMFKNYITRVVSDKPNAGVRAIFLVSCGTSESYKKQIKSLAYYAGINDVDFMLYALADLVGCGVKVDDILNCLMVDINNNYTDVVVMSKHGIEDAVSINFGTQNIDKAIYEQVRFRYAINLSEESIADVKENLASLVQNGALNMSFTGQDTRTHETKTIKITSIDIYDVIKEFYDVIAETIVQMIYRQPEEVREALAIQGAIFCGKGSGVQNLREFMENKIGIPVFVASYECSLFGLGKISKNKKLYKKYRNM